MKGYRYLLFDNRAKLKSSFLSTREPHDLQIKYQCT